MLQLNGSRSTIVFSRLSTEGQEDLKAFIFPHMESRKGMYYVQQLLVSMYRAL